MVTILLRPDRVGYAAGSMTPRKWLVLHVMREDQLRPGVNMSICAINLDTVQALGAYELTDVDVCLHCVNIMGSISATARINNFGMVVISHPGSFLRIKCNGKIMVEQR